MNQHKSGQAFQPAPNNFAVGNLVALFHGQSWAACGVILGIEANDSPCPAALCAFGDQDIRRVPLADLTALHPKTSVETGYMYTIHRACDGDDEDGLVMGVSWDKDILLDRMLKELDGFAKKDFSLVLSHAIWNEKEDMFQFCFESDGGKGLSYLAYSIQPVPVFSKVEGGNAV